MCQCRSLLCVNSSQKHVLQLKIPSKDIQKGSPSIKSKPSLLSVACGVKSTAVECDKKGWDKTLWFHTKCSTAIRSYCIGPPRWSVRPQVSDNADHFCLSFPHRYMLQDRIFSPKDILKGSSSMESKPSKNSFTLCSMWREVNSNRMWHGEGEMSLSN